MIEAETPTVVTRDQCAQAAWDLIQELQAENARLLQAVANGGIKAGELTARVIDLERRLNPRQWTPAMHDAWHKALPDTQRAFEALADCETDAKYRRR